MKFEKIFAGLMAALTTLMTLVYPTLAAVTLGDYPTFLGKDGTLNAYVVVGSGAAASDVAGAVDVAARLAELSYTTKSSGVTAESVDGLLKDTIPLSDTLSNTFPTLIKTIHYSGLKDSVYTWRSNDYDYYEDIVLGNTKVNHDFGTDKINGTEKMIVESGQVMYEFVFDKDLTGTGDTSTKNYTYPINIKVLGKDFSIVGSGSSSLVALSGSIGTATATQAVTQGDYSVYSDLGYNDGWARVIVKDKNGNTVDSKTINRGDSWDFSSLKLTVKITAVRALQDGTVVGADLVVGPTGSVERTYTTSCDITSTGTEDKKFPGETEWCIQVSGFGVAGKLAKADKIQVVYKPSETKYLLAGEKLPLPNNYGELGFLGWNKDRFVKITSKTITGLTVYNASADTQSFGNMNGIVIESDVAGSIIDPNTNTGYNKAYVLFNYTQASDYNPVMIAFYDAVKQKPMVNFTGSTYYKVLRPSWDNVSSNFEFTFNISYGGASSVTDQQLLEVNISTAAAGVTSWINLFRLGGSSGVTMRFYNKTATWSTSAAPEFRLYTTDSAQDEDVAVVTTDTSGTPSSQNVGKATQDVVSDAGNIVVSPTSYSGSQTVVVKVPAEALKVKAYVGKLGAAGSAGTYKAIVPVTSALAVLDTEVTATHKTKNFVTVGGPCINKITAEALGLTFPTCGAVFTTATGIGAGEALIQVVSDYPATGLYTVVVVGYEAANSRTASTVLQQYDTLLKGQTASKVKVTSATAAGITPIVPTTTTTTAAATTTTTAT
jgi:hypothetical protein